MIVSIVEQELHLLASVFENVADGCVLNAKDAIAHFHGTSVLFCQIGKALPGLRGGGGLIMRPGRQRGRRAGLCRAGGYCGRIERSPDRRAASPGKCRGAGVARSAATTRTLPGY